MLQGTEMLCRGYSQGDRVYMRQRAGGSEVNIWKGYYVVRVVSSSGCRQCLDMQVVSYFIH